MALPNNPIEVTLKILNSKWKFIIIRELLKSDKRFNQLKKDVTGISQKILSAKLKELEADGFVTKITIEDVTFYRLTDLGLTLKSVIDSLYDWGKDYKKYNKLLSK